MSIGKTVRDFLGIDALVATLELHQKSLERPRYDIERQVHPSHERYLASLSNIRQKIERSVDDSEIQIFELAYFSILNHARQNRIVTRGEYDNLTSQLAQSVVRYFRREKT